MKAHFKIFQIDETHNWTERIAQIAGPIMGTYIYDALQHTYCCEMTPSHWCVQLGSSFSYHPGLQDDDRETLADDIEQGDMECDGSHYRHVHHVGQIPGQHDFGIWKTEPGETYDQLVDRVLEHYRGNPIY